MILYRDINLFDRSNSGLRILEWDRIQKKLAKIKSTNKTYNGIQYFAFIQTSKKSLVSAQVLA